MAYSTRKAMYKQVMMASGNLDDALQHLLRFKDTYQEPHPEIAEAVEAVMVVVLQTQTLIKGLLKIF